MKTLHGLLVLLLAVPAVAQQETEAKRAYDALEKEYDAAMAAYSEKMKAIASTPEYQAASKERDFDKVRELRSKVTAPDRDAWAARFLAGAAPFAGTDGAVPFLTWAARSGSGDVQAKAVEAVTAAHLESPALDEFVESLSWLSRGIGEDKARSLAEAVTEKNPDPVIKANAHYALAMMLRAPRGESLGEEQQAARDRHLAKVVEIAPDSIVAMKVAAPEFERTRLQTGMVAPDIVGRDLDGEEFKLSDYRGKVVVLDFWGDW